MKRPKQALSSYQQQANHDWEFAKRLLFRDGGVDTTFFVYAKDRIVNIPVNWQTEEEKLHSFASVRLLMIATGAEVVSFRTEAWMRDVSQRPGESKAEQMARAAAVAPQDAENRIDTLLTVLYYYDDAGEMRSIVRRGEIQRNAADKPRAVTDLDGDGDQMTGFLQTVFAAEVTAEERELASQYLHSVQQAGLIRKTA